jgi:hypothetical protein
VAATIVNVEVVIRRSVGTSTVADDIAEPRSRSRAIWGSAAALDGTATTSGAISAAVAVRSRDMGA